MSNLGVEKGASTNLNQGLTSEEVSRQRAKFGRNEIPEHHKNLFRLFIRRFWGISPWMLEITIILTGVMGKFIEMFVILTLLIFNAILGFLQEEKANHVLSYLKQRIRPNARIKRNGTWIIIPAEEVVPGDVIRVRLGDVVPADIAIKEGQVEADQSVLTGESLPVEKMIGDIIYSGSTVKRGESTGIITATGINTYFGRTVDLVQLAKPKLQMEVVTSKVARAMLIMVAGLLTIGIIFGLLKGADIEDLIILTIILLIASIPIALPTVITVTTALGSLELSKNGVLVTRLDSIEDAALMNVLCADKTGTITQNRLTFEGGINYKSSLEDIIRYGTLASNESDQDPIDLAFVQAAQERHISLTGYVQTRFIPFDPTLRRTSAVISHVNEQFIAVKGAFRAILALCDVALNEKTELEKQVEIFASKGHRVIAVAYGKFEEGKEAIAPNSLNLIGIAAFYDPPRSNSAQMIRELADLGVTIKILTGDGLPIAKSIAQQIGIGDDIIPIKELKNAPTEEAKFQLLSTKNGFAEIYPEDKYFIVKSLQDHGQIVGMTGDGVNDAPALGAAEVGIAVSNATDIAKQAASAILTSGGLEHILDFIKSGRRIYQRIVTWVLNKIIKTFLIVVFTIFAFLITDLLIINVLGMLLLLFFNDFITVSISTDRVSYSRSPDTWNISNLVKVAICLGSAIVIESLGLLFIGFNLFGLGSNQDQLHMFVFVFLVISGLCILLVARERKHFWNSRPSTPLTIAIIGAILIVSILSQVNLPSLAAIPLSALGLVLGYSVITCLLLNDFLKIFIIKKFKVKI
ncbi:MAG: plasma-membrane proton-efflux P-type ATPase [Candidatus Helarchaeota archaeon]|nr:plasma-membrane proton-efflux P-type ATPase [Candidatus Helarchaeota archaeon]